MTSENSAGSLRSTGDQPTVSEATSAEPLAVCPLEPHDQASAVSRRSPLNADEVRHQQRCQSAYCASQGHDPYRERQQQAYVPVPELGHPDWNVVWGWSHIIGPRRPRLYIGWH